jgi:hypothetical protein
VVLLGVLAGAYGDLRRRWLGISVLTGGFLGASLIPVFVWASPMNVGTLFTFVGTFFALVGIILHTLSVWGGRVMAAPLRSPQSGT